MTIGAVYASDLSRVRVSCSSAPALADYATIERSVDQITWVTVRGGSAVPLTANACQLDDYEFVEGQTNYYRARYVDAADPSVTLPGTLGSAVNASVTPGLPAGLVDGDILVLMAAIRNTAGNVNTPAGWTLWTDGGNFRVFTRIYASGQTAPTVTFTGGVAGADTAARIVAVRNSDYNINSLFQSNASAQDMAHPAMASGPVLPNLFLVAGWKQAAVTLSTMPAPWVAISRDSVTAGDDQTILWWHAVTSASVAAGTVTLTGGVAAISEVAMLRFTKRPYLSQETATVLPTLNSVWLKNLGLPFLNRAVTVTGFSDIDQPSRSGSFVIVGRRSKVAVTDVRGGNEYTLTLKTETLSDADDLKAVLATGNVVLLHLPSAYRHFPGGYYLVGNLRTRRAQSIRSPRRYHDLVLEEVAAPSAVVVGTTITYQGVINAYATYSAVIAANATYADVMSRIGTPADVVVP